MPFMVKILHNTAGNFLFVERILNVECAESLALAYAETIEKDARANLTADPTSKFKILANSFFSFILSVDKNSKTVYPVTTYVFGNEWFVAFVNYRCINQR
ncbi:hypothetical protein AVEN_103256-1 [Araneus ventricosus]|uniref:Uncharacterized protein n=1 Tax=Araneus ventricosus TaxID=182803 RepID=A0A4Y2R5Q2_ARAVE|nr:hypothetical protein AVEN_103256-1 [Araneus ventricosus]